MRRQARTGRRLVRVTVRAMGSAGQRVAALRRTHDTKPLWQRAAEELLIAHSTLLAQPDFCAQVILGDGDQAVIDWDRAAGVLANAMAGSGPVADLVVLAFAVALGTDRLHLSQMDPERRQLVLAAVTSVVSDWTDDQPSPLSLTTALVATMSPWER